MDILKDLPQTKIERLIQEAQSFTYRKNDGTYLAIIIVVYKVMSYDQCVYFPFKGEFINQVPLDIRKSTKYPIGRAKWEILVTVLKLLRTSGYFKPGSIFGHLECSANLPRKSQVQAVALSKVYYISWETYANSKLRQKE